MPALIFFAVCALALGYSTAALVFITLYLILYFGILIYNIGAAA